MAEQGVDLVVPPRVLEEVEVGRLAEPADGGPGPLEDGLAAAVGLGGPVALGDVGDERRQAPGVGARPDVVPRVAVPGVHVDLDRAALDDGPAARGDEAARAPPRPHVVEEVAGGGPDPAVRPAPGERGGLRVEVGDPPPAVDGEEPLVHAREHALDLRLLGRQPVLGVAALGHLAPELELGDDGAGEVPERGDLGVADPAGHPVAHAQRPDAVAVRRRERGAGVEPDARRSRHERVVGEPGVGPGVLDHERRAGPDDPVAEGDLPVRLAHVEPDRRLEPLAVGVEERDERGRHVEQGGREPDGPVERLLGRRVEDGVAVERGEAGGLAAGRPRDPSGSGRGSARGGGRRSGAGRGHRRR